MLLLKPLHLFIADSCCESLPTYVDFFICLYYFRKKIFDFYQRAMLSSYCSVLAYQPVVDHLPEYEDNLYIELPSGFGKHAHMIKEAESPELVR